ncbi:MAG: ketoacyl-ACP synthase III [Saprospiraceae bacterium]|nr:ketoacyl-ACP synthase III [Saprospiraceae bacterium]MCF8250855.1 ketoacyl-ACP synthase III [Saprospiraceae bacterium]MCF8280686.1 ketoacyl-ACP synthase III [Bacteroidales bacterium]MCF8312744.1 ketoacyl-ACP synthase III [Saprospiraceae bacterium]MCF8441191.1 ketoacyl-ACP synthase III [Saprospiraceae bacterium]
MTNTRSAITGIHAYVPDYVLTNTELEKTVETNDEWIASRTGIRERRILKGEGLATSYLGEQAVRGLLEKTGTKPEEVELLICATVTPDMMFPDTANLIAYRTGMKNAFTFDLSAACSGFLFALTTGAKYIESGMYKKVIVVGADKMSSIVDYTDRATCILFGDAGGAVMLEPSKDGNGIMDSILHSDGIGSENLYQRGGGSLKPASHETVDAKEHFIFQNGRPVYKAAVAGMAGVVKEMMQKHNLAADDISWVVPHQANLRIIESVANMADFPMEKVMVNIQKYGNTTAATIPLCLWEWENQLKKGDNLILTAFGGGYTWGAIWVKWAY